MDADRHAQVREAFLRICELPEDERSAALERIGCGDPQLRREVESLLRYHRASPEDRPTAESLPERIAGYRVVRRLGEGGMGVVFEVLQDRPVRRRLALKLIKWGVGSAEILARFETERQALALMDHPNISRIFDAGTAEDGRPFFTMEFVDGEPITAYCDRHRLSTAERLAMFAQVCDGVQHAHHNGIIHRDIKPSNVLVRVREGRPVPTIIDFGVAKATQQRLTERTVYTERGMLIGTPEYMSPEQADLTGLDVDTRTDVYSLGVLLYELLVGALPFDPATLRQAGFDEIRRKIREEEPSRPSTRVRALGDACDETARRRRTDPPGLRRELDGDLDWITMRALEKDRARRYGSPGEMAEDIARHLRHEPVLAGPPDTLYRVRKFVRRHRVGVATSLAVALALLVGLALATAGLLRARQAERAARDEAARANKVAGLMTGMFDDLNRAVPGHVVTLEQVVDRGAQRIESELAGEPVLQSRLLSYLAGAYGSLGQSERARELVERSVELGRANLPPNDPDLAATVALLGDVVLGAGDLERAQRLHEEALAMWSASLGPDTVSISIGRSHQTLGVIRFLKGDFRAARSRLDRSQEILERFDGTYPIHLAHTLFWQARLDSDVDQDHETALSRLERALTILQSEFGQDHAQTLETRLWLARVHQRLGHADAAREHYTRAAEIERRELGRDGYVAAVSAVGLGELLAQRGDLDEARDELEAACAALGPDARPEDRDWCARTLADVYLRRGELARARGLLEHSLAELERAAGSEHPVLTRTLHALGRVELAAGDLDRAEAWYLRTLAIQREFWDSGHYVNTWALYQLACIAARRGREQQAIDRLREALDAGYDRETLLDDPDLDGLRDRQDFAALVAEVRRRRGSPAAGAATQKR